MALTLQLDHMQDGALIDRLRFNERLGQVIKIGRCSSAHLLVDNPQVARLHAIIEFRQDGPYLQAMADSRTTTLNGELVLDSVRLGNEDRIALGGQEILVRLHDLEHGRPGAGGAPHE